MELATAAVDGDAPATTCRNCAATLTGDHCHGCGQPAHVHRSVAAIGHDLMHGVLHLDGKLANTLPLLLLKPGQLTRRYIAGERRRFVSPMGLFLFSVTILFLLMQALGVHIGQMSEQASVGPALTRAEKALKSTLAEPLPDNAYTKGVAIGADVGPSDPTPEDQADDQRSRVEVRDRAARTLAAVKQAHTLWSQDGDLDSVEITGNTPAIVGRMLDKFKTDPALVFYKMQANSYKFSWALIPLSVPFVWLLFFWRRDVGLYDHTVFVTYSIAFVTLLTCVLVILSRLSVPAEGLASAFVIIPPVHLFVQLRGAYSLKKRWALVRTLILLFLMLFILTGFGLILLALGALG